MPTITCPTAKLDGKSSPSNACNCGTEALVPITTSEFCTVGTGNTGTKAAKIVCTPSTAGGAGVVSPNGGCLCGSDNVDTAAGSYCGLKADGTGLVMPTITCPTAKLDGKSSPSNACNCGTEALVPITTSEFCYAINGNTGTKTAKQCDGYSGGAGQADGTTKAAQACACGTASATTCDFCFKTASAVSSAAWETCSPADGTGKFKKKPNKCKCGTGSATFDEYCLNTHNGPIAACSNNDGTVLNGAAPCACVNSATGVAQVTQANIGLCNAGVQSTISNCAANSAVNTAAFCVCGTSTCTSGQTCTGNTCATPATTPAPTPAPTFAETTITQTLTVGGTDAATVWANNLKTCGELAYAEELGWTTGFGSSKAIATGYTVTSTAARRGYTITFTAKGRISATAVTAATTAANAITGTSLNAKMAQIKTDFSYSSITVPTAANLTPGTATAVTATPAAATVSGASTVTTSIMAMAVAVLAAFQARQ